MTSNTSNSDSTILASFDLNSQFDERYTVGVDLGQAQDSTAISVVRKVERFPGKPIFQVGHLSRVKLGTPYPAIVSHVMDMLSRPRFRGKSDLVIDATGCGRPVFDMFCGFGIAPIGVLITSGTTVTRDGTMFHVPKLNLVSRVQALLHDERLHIHKEIPDAAALVNELQNFRAEYTDTGYVRFNARGAGAHDDLVLSLAIACWYAAGDGDASFGNWMSFMHGGGLSGRAKPGRAQPQVLLKRFDQTNQVLTIKGRCINVPESGVVQVDPEEASPLLAAGWTRVNE